VREREGGRGERGDKWNWKETVLIGKVTGEATNERNETKERTREREMETGNEERDREIERKVRKENQPFSSLSLSLSRSLSLVLSLSMISALVYTVNTIALYSVFQSQMAEILEERFNLGFPAKKSPQRKISRSLRARSLSLSLAFSLFMISALVYTVC
jgi:archaellum biogenesis protein FlaJ (TadC family)